VQYIDLRAIYFPTAYRLEVACTDWTGTTRRLMVDVRIIATANRTVESA